MKHEYTLVWYQSVIKHAALNIWCKIVKIHQRHYTAAKVPCFATKSFLLLLVPSGLTERQCLVLDEQILYVLRHLLTECSVAAFKFLCLQLCILHLQEKKYVSQLMICRFATWILVTQGYALWALCHLCACTDCISSSSYLMDDSHSEYNKNNSYVSVFLCFKERIRELSKKWTRLVISHKMIKCHYL